MSTNAPHHEPPAFDAPRVGGPAPDVAARTADVYPHRTADRRARRSALAEELRMGGPRRLLWGNPVLRKDLLATSRRRRYYLLRFAFVLTLAAFTAAVWQAETDDAKFRVPPPEMYHAISSDSEARVEDFLARPGMDRLAKASFLMPDIGKAVARQVVWFVFFASQGIMVVLCSTAMSGEIGSRTLPALLSTPLSYFQIVWGKLLGRLSHVLTLVLCAMPMLAVARVFGGVEWSFVINSAVLTVAAAMGIGALTIYYSIRHKPWLAMLLTLAVFVAVHLVFLPLAMAIMDSSADSPLLIFLTTPLCAMLVCDEHLMRPSGTDLSWLSPVTLAVMVAVAVWLTRAACRQLRTAVYEKPTVTVPYRIPVADPAHSHDILYQLANLSRTVHTDAGAVTPEQIAAAAIARSTGEQRGMGVSPMGGTGFQPVSGMGVSPMRPTGVSPVGLEGFQPSRDGETDSSSSMVQANGTVNMGETPMPQPTPRPPQMPLRRRLRWRWRLRGMPSPVIARVGRWPVFWRETHGRLITASKNRNLPFLLNLLAVVAVLLVVGCSWLGQLRIHTATHSSVLILLLLAGLGLSLSLSASTLAAQRQTRTLAVLLATPLSRWVILRDTVLAVYWRGRFIWLILLTHLALACLLGQLHPLAGVHVLMIAGGASLLVIGVGLWIGSRVRTPTLSVLATLAVFVLAWAVVPATANRVVAALGTVEIQLLHPDAPVNVSPYIAQAVPTMMIDLAITGAPGPNSRDYDQFRWKNYDHNTPRWRYNPPPILVYDVFDRCYTAGQMTTRLAAITGGYATLGMFLLLLTTRRLKKLG